MIDTRRRSIWRRICGGSCETSQFTRAGLEAFGAVKWAKRHPWQSALVATVGLATITYMVETARHNAQLRAEALRTEAKAAEARQNYEEARGAIQAMLFRAGGRQFDGVPRARELRRGLREDAAAFYERVLRAIDSKDPIVRADTARALSEASTLQHELGQTVRAEEHVRRAISLFESLQAEGRCDLEMTARHAECLARLSCYLIELKRFDEAILAAEQAVDRAEGVVRAAPEDLAHRELLAACHHDLGTACWKAGRNEDAKVHYRKAIAIRETIDQSKVPGLALTLAESLINDALVLWKGQKKLPDAEKRLVQAEKLLVSGSNGQVESIRGDVIFAQVQGNRAGIFLESGEYKKALERVDAGLNRVEPYLKSDPNEVVVRNTCLSLHGNRAFALGALDRHAESAAEWDRVIELSDKPVPADCQVHRALELLYAGNVAEALAQAENLKGATGVSAVDCYNLACLFAVSAGAVPESGSPAADQRSDRVESLVGDALNWLRSAAATRTVRRFRAAG